MHTIPEEEARALLRSPLVCEEVAAWTPQKVQPGVVSCGAGVLSVDGQSVHMYVDLSYQRTQKTRMTKYIFTVFKRQRFGSERVYQLEVTQTPKRIKDTHRLSHEHMGLLRTLGDASWSEWGYHDVLAHFCESANITFAPQPAHPEDFHLTADR